MHTLGADQSKSIYRAGISVILSRNSTEVIDSCDRMAAVLVQREMDNRPSRL